MSRSHQNSNLNIQGTIVGVDNYTQAFFPLKDHANDIIYGIQSTTNTNITLTQDGIAIEEATTNLCPNPQFDLGLSGWGFGAGGGMTLDVSTGLFSKQSLKVIVASGGVDQYHHISYDSGGTIAGSIFTFSAYVKCVGLSNGNGVHLSTYWYDSGGSWIWANNVLSTNTLNNCDWTKITATSTAPANARYAVIIMAPQTKDGVGTYWVGGTQIEQKAFATAFVNGSRINPVQGLQIPMMIKTFPFSVTMNVIPDIKNGVNASYGAEPQIMYIAGLWQTGWGSYSGQIHQQARSGITGGLENGFRYTLIYRSDSWDAYINTTKVQSSVAYYQPNYIFEIPNFTIGARGNELSLGYANAQYKDVSFYNKALSDNEIVALYNSTLSYNSEEGVCT